MVPRPATPGINPIPPPPPLALTMVRCFLVLLACIAATGDGPRARSARSARPRARPAETDEALSIYEDDSDNALTPISEAEGVDDPVGIEVHGEEALQRFLVEESEEPERKRKRKRTCRSVQVISLTLFKPLSPTTTK